MHILWISFALQRSHKQASLTDSIINLILNIILTNLVNAVRL